MTVIEVRIWDCAPDVEVADQLASLGVAAFRAHFSSPCMLCQAIVSRER